MGEESLNEYSRALRALWKRSGPVAQADIIAAAKRLNPPMTLSPNSVSGWLNGRYVPSQAARSEFLIAYLLREARRLDPDVQVPPKAWWETQRKAALAERRQGRAGRPLGAHPPVEPATTIGSLNPLDLGVHHTIEVGRGDLPLLTPYATRPHDTALREFLSNTTGHRMAVLIGGSSTGKTRSLYEAALAVPELASWPVLVFSEPAELSRALQEGIAPRTLLWLDEAQNYLDATRAAALYRLLTTGGGPVVILASMWPKVWTELTDNDRSDSAFTPGRGLRPDSGEPARRLLSASFVRRFDVPSSLEGDPDDPGLDPRLAVALHTAGPRRNVIQVLAGGVKLLEWFEYAAAPASRAITAAAVDARRLGFLSPVPHDLLRDAAPDYLDDDELDLDDDWLATALSDNVLPRLGVSAVRNVHTERRSIGPPNAVVPHDYLVQYLPAPRPVPAALWEAALAHCPASETHRLAQSALSRHQLRLAAAFLLKGVGVSPEARSLLAREIHRLTDDPLPWLRHLAEQGTPDAIWAVISHQDEFDLAERRRWWKAMVESDEKRAMHDLRGRLMESGLADEAEQWLADAATEGDPLAPAALATLLDGYGADRAEDRLRWWSRAQELDHYGARWSVIHALDDLGRVDEADQLRLAEARGGSGWMYAEYATSRVRAGRPDEARDAVLEALAPNSTLTRKARQRILDMLQASDWPDAYPELVSFLTPESRPKTAELARLKEEEGDLDAAEELWTRASKFTPSGIVAFYERHGRLEDARRLLETLDNSASLLSFRLRHDGIEAAAETARHLMDEGKPTAAHRLAELLDQLDRPDDAERWFRIAAEADDRRARWALIRFLTAQGRHSEALSLARRLLPDSPRLPDLMLQAGNVEEAESRLRSAAITDDNRWHALVTFLETTERHSEASAIARYGLEPDGSTSKPWEFPAPPGQTSYS